MDRSIPVSLVIRVGYAFIAWQIATTLAVHTAIPRLIGDAEDVVFVLSAVLVVLLEAIMVG